MTRRTDADSNRKNTSDDDCDEQQHTTTAASTMSPVASETGTTSLATPITAQLPSSSQDESVETANDEASALVGGPSTRLNAVRHASFVFGCLRLQRKLWFLVNSAVCRSLLLGSRVFFFIL